MSSYNVRKLSKNEVLKAIECYDRYPYMPFWWIVREISQNKYGIDNLNYEFKYGYDNPEKGHFHESYSPSKELKDIYRCMQNYIDNKNYNRPHNTSLSMQDYVISSCKQGENSYLNFAEYVNRGNFEQALNERDYWRGARRFVEKYLPTEINTQMQQEDNVAKARRFGRMAYKYVGDIIASNNMSSSDPSAIAMHGTIGGMIAQMCGNYYIRGEELGKLNKAIVAKIYENRKTIGFSDRDVINFSRRLGEYLGKVLGLGENLGGEIAEMATRWNDTGAHNNGINDQFYQYISSLRESAKNLNYNQIVTTNFSWGRFTIGLAMDRNCNVYIMGNVGYNPNKGNKGYDLGVFSIPDVDENDANGLEKALTKKIDFNATLNYGKARAGITGSIDTDKPFKDSSINAGFNIGADKNASNTPLNLGLGTTVSLGPILEGNAGTQFKNSYNNALMDYIRKNPKGDYDIRKHSNGQLVLVRENFGRRQMWTERNFDNWMTVPISDDDLNKWPKLSN